MGSSVCECLDGNYCIICDGEEAHPIQKLFSGKLFGSNHFGIQKWNSSENGYLNVKSSQGALSGEYCRHSFPFKHYIHSQTLI